VAKPDDLVTVKEVAGAALPCFTSRAEISSNVDAAAKSRF